jgi:chitin-binding protein
MTAVARVLSAGAVVGTLLAVTALPAHAAGDLTCRYTLTAWTGGFSADLRISNGTATTINGWTAFWTFDHATQVTSTWTGSITQSTPYDATARNAFYNGTIHPGGSASLGWTATAAATDIPDGIVVNGVDCPVV